MKLWIAKTRILEESNYKIGKYDKMNCSRSLYLEIPGAALVDITKT